MSKTPISLELYSVRKALEKDMPGTLKKVKSLGYDAVEMYGGTPVNRSPEEYAAAIRDAGLWLSGWHISPDDLFSSEEHFREVVKFHQAVGNKYLIMAWLPDAWLSDYETLKQTADKLNAMSRRLAEYGLATGYHNHSEAFHLIPETGKSMWSTLRELTVPEFVMQLDTGNALCGNADVNAEVFAAEGRLPLVHLKPYSRKTGYETVLADLGDDIDYAAILPFCQEKGGTKVFVIEYECEALFDEIEGVRICIDNLKAKYGDLL